MKKDNQVEDKRIIKEDEIDLLALFQTFWAGRKIIIQFLLIFGFLGLFIAIFSPKKYTASTMIVPVSSGKSASGGLSGLAAMAGIDIDTSQGGGDISPTLYPKVVESIPFRKRLMDTPITVSEKTEKVTFRKYYKDIYSIGLLGWVKKYTIGLPGVILGWFKEKPKEVQGESGSSEIVVISRNENELLNKLRSLIKLNVNKKEGYIVISATMPEALAAAQMADRAQKLLQEYVIKFKTQKASEQLNFVENRCKEKEKEFREVEMALARFKDRNRNVATSTAMTRKQRLTSEYNLLYSVYSELARKVETQRIQVKEDTPVFRVIEPVSVPVEKSAPRRMMILAVWLFLGFFLGVAVVFGREFIKTLKQKR